MSRRAGVLSLLLHSTYNHELASKMAMMKQKKAMAAGGGGSHQQGLSNIFIRILLSENATIMLTRSCFFAKNYSSIFLESQTFNFYIWHIIST